jgi:hypothetical protein
MALWCTVVNETQKNKFDTLAIVPVDRALLEKLRALLAKCPIEHQASILHLAQFMEHVQEHAAVNKMHYDNLAIVFGPTILGRYIVSSGVALSSTILPTHCWILLH